MVDERLAAIAAVEGRDDVVLRTVVDLVGWQERQDLAIPASRVGCVPRHEDGVRDALDARWPPPDAQQLAGAAQLVRSRIHGLLYSRQRRDCLYSADDLDSIAERVR